MRSPDPQVYLLHIRDCCEDLKECVTLRERGGLPPSILFNAACRSLEIIGEASSKIGPEFRAAHLDIPWRKMNDLRNVLIHNYAGVDADMIWGIARARHPAAACGRSPFAGRTNPVAHA